jgi:hypothetical protein
MSIIDDSSAHLIADTRTRHFLLGTQLFFFFALAWCLILNHGPRPKMTEFPSTAYITRRFPY